MTDSIREEVHVIDLQARHSKPIVEVDDWWSPALAIANDFLAVAYIKCDGKYDPSGIIHGRVALFSRNATFSPKKLHELFPFQIPQRILSMQIASWTSACF